ncbi:ATP-dependent Clp protease ATP-binding subunit, partial [Candidatus Peribacteria bacterium]|nr:ATP-dependent Clp protease ATP-binding subunit [Candidatus Peribacteria bacterium]
IEKAHPKVITVFLQVLDEGMLIDSVGNKTDFRHTIIIATSNAGALFLRSATVGDSLKKELIDALIAEKVFSPEFLNRFDEIVLYKSLSLEGATRVSRNMIESIVAELRTKRGVTVTLEEGVVEAVVRRGYSREFGAREMRRAIVEFIENVLAEYMLKHDVKRGDTIHIRVQDLPGA